MNYKEVAEILAGGAFKLTQFLAPHYKVTPIDRDYYIWESMAFLLAYFYTFDGLSQQEVIGLITQFSKNYPDSQRRALSHLWVLTATQFYGTHTWNIKTGKSIMPDVILYNLCRTCSDKKEDVPLTEQDSIMMIGLWTQCISYITENIIPPFNNYFNGDKT